MIQGSINQAAAIQHMDQFQSNDVCIEHTRLPFLSSSYSNSLDTIGLCWRSCHNSAGFQADVDRWDKFRCGGVPDSLVHGLCTNRVCIPFSRYTSVLTLPPTDQAMVCRRKCPDHLRLGDSQLLNSTCCPTTEGKLTKIYDAHLLLPPHLHDYKLPVLPQIVPPPCS